jgi:hypothetical protein
MSATATTPRVGKFPGFDREALRRSGTPAVAEPVTRLASCRRHSARTPARLHTRYDKPRRCTLRSYKIYHAISRFGVDLMLPATLVNDDRECRCLVLFSNG